MYAATASMKVACDMQTSFTFKLDSEGYTDMNAKPAEHRHLLFCNVGKGRDKKQHILQIVKTAISW